jgi:hypothetical protein
MQGKHEHTHQQGSLSIAVLEHARQEQQRSSHVLQATSAHMRQQGSLSSTWFQHVLGTRHSIAAQQREQAVALHEQHANAWLLVASRSRCWVSPASEVNTQGGQGAEAKQAKHHTLSWLICY